MMEHRLKEYQGNDKNQISIHGELNKLAANVAIGRNMAGVHYRSDYIESTKLGEDHSNRYFRGTKNKLF